MSYLDTLVERYGDIFAPVPEPTAERSIVTDRFDEAIWDETYAQVGELQRQVVEVGADNDYVEDFTADLYQLALKADPTIRTPQEMAPSHAPNAGMVAGFAEMPEVQELRALTTGDQYAAAMAVVSLQDDIKEAYSAMRAARERAEELAQARVEAGAARQAAGQAAADAEADAEASGEGEPSAEAQEAAESAAEAAQQATTDMLEAAQKLADEMAAANQSMRSQMKSAAKQAADKIAEEAELMGAFGVDPGELQRMSFAERAALAERLRNNRLAKFAKLIGAFRRMAEAEQRRRVSTVADEIVGVKLGDDLLRLTPQEMVNLAVPELEDDFWLRYANHSLLVYDLAGKEKQGRGPIIAVVDESGSMGSPFGPHGTREAWSKAFALSLCDQARRQNRDFHYVGFSSARQVWSLSFPGGKAPLSDVIDMTEHFWGGGTNYEGPLDVALEIMETHYGNHVEAGWTNSPKPDVVLISDDEYGGLDEDFMHRWHATKDKTGMRCFGIAIAAGYGGAMNAVSDNVRSILDLAADPSQVKDIFRTV
jgi:uncharacterized protein with von Willebrand factor type A (vWA) domain